MKKVATLLVFVLAFTFTSQAQREFKERDGEQMSVEQKTNLAVKKMALKLDLTESQQNKIRPLLAEKVADRQAMYAKRKAMKESGKKREKLSKDERYNKADARLDKMIAFKAEMKNILTQEQYEKFEKHAGKRKEKKQNSIKKRSKNN